jgi:ribonucleoside-diphosphate reductase alpha chain
MHKRLAKEFARIEQKYKNPLSYEEIYNMLVNFNYIIPGGSILYGVGNNYSISSLGNCFVVGNAADSYGGICNTDEEQVQLMKRRAGVGHDISHLRPANSNVSNAANTSTGAVSFMERFSNSTREVAQGGRRGALMLSMDINHPDSEAFIKAKNDLSKITGANISVKIDDTFMSIVGDKRGEFIAINDTWDKLIHQAWKSAEPGVLFWDKIKSESIPSCYGKEWEETSTNPCGEIPLCPYDSCRLLSVNLYSCVDNPFTPEASFSWNKFKDVVYKAQRLMDDIIDLEEEKINKILDKIDKDPENEEIKQVEKNLWIKIRNKLLQGRRTGLSAIGLADAFAALSIQYGEDNSIQLAEEIYKQFAIAAYKSSIDMAKERGCFPIYKWTNEITNSYIARISNWLSSENNIDHLNTGRRNIALLTIPPSGTISLLAGISSGIEPVYQLSYKRRRKVDENHSNKSFKDQNGDWWEEYTIYHPKLKDWLENQWYPAPWDEEIPIKIPFSEINQYMWESPYINSTAYELDPIQRVKLQGTIQKWIDHSISSTINLPESVTEEEVSNIYIQAWKEGCKGLTIYRDNCRTGILVSNDKKEDDFFAIDAPKRPKELECDIHTTSSQGELYNVVIGIYKGRPYEVFATRDIMTRARHTKGSLIKIKRGHYKVNGTINREHLMENMSDSEKIITRLVSGQLRHRKHIKYVVSDLYKLPGDMGTFAKVLARILKLYITDNEKITGEVCGNCGGNKLIYINGCQECPDCGNSKCS